MFWGPWIEIERKEGGGQSERQKDNCHVDKQRLERARHQLKKKTLDALLHIFLLFSLALFRRSPSLFSDFLYFGLPGMKLRSRLRFPLKIISVSAYMPRTSPFSADILLIKYWDIGLLYLDFWSVLTCLRVKSRTESAITAYRGINSYQNMWTVTQLLFWRNQRKDDGQENQQSIW